MTSLRYFLVPATLSATGCGGGSDAPREAPAPAPAVSNPVDSAIAGSLKGTILNGDDTTEPKEAKRLSFTFML